ncbi:MAG TPA: nitrilase-related carbon-nitrogen hydrolase [Ktedonobacteraceae bacterium]|jgi:apolipoprotein N-acyltransferase|nr:nitrilase-related carbon-nitrogen hydrolase [Ktedonobacteraceae bacterium]
MNTEQISMKKQSMNRRFPAQQAELTDRFGYFWLAPGTLFSLFAANGVWNMPLAAWLAPLFFLRFTRTRSLRNGLIGVWLSSVVITLFWMYQSSFYDPQLLSPVNLLMFAIILASHTLLVIPYLLDRLLAPRLMLFSGLLASLIFPMGLATCEYINALVVPYGYFFSAGATQYGNLPLLQVTALTGVYGVSFLIAWFASVSNWIWEQHFSWPRIRTLTLLYSGVLILVLLGGSIRLTFFAPSSATVRVAGVSTPKAIYQQATDSLAALKQPDRAQLRAAYTMVENALFIVSQREANAGAKIISWPEIEVSTLPEDETSLLARGQALASKGHIYLEMAYRVVQLDQTPVHNRAVLIDPTGHILWTYDKTHPAPGADPSIPGNGDIPVVDTPYGRLSTVICLDAFYPTLMHQTGNQGIDIMIVPSQEWDDNAGGSMTWVTQATSLRAIEYGYALVRQASGDVAMTVDDQGHVLVASDYHMTDQQTMVAYVPVKGTWTIYGMIGDLFTWLCLAGLFALTLFAAISALKARTHLPHDTDAYER